MINSELKKSSISNLLVEQGNLHAEGKVRTIHMSETMNLVGFIPYTNYFMLYNIFVMNVDLNAHLYVAPFLVKFSEGGPVFPYFKYVADATGKKYPVDGNLYADTVLEAIPENISRTPKCSVPLNGKQMLNLIKYRKIDKFQDLFEKQDDDTYIYTGREGEYELTGGLGYIRAIARDVLSLCSYINTVSGRINYAVLPSDEVIKVLNKEDYE